MKYYAHFGLHRLRALPRLQGRGDQAVLPDLQRGAGQRLRPLEGGAKVHLLKTDIHDWNITFVDTGLHACIGERLRAVRHLLRDDEMFLANYGDTLTDANLPAMIAGRKATGATASFLAVRPNYSFHVVTMDDAGIVDGIRDVTRSDVWINGGYFVFRSEILDELRPGRGARRGAVPSAAGPRPTAGSAPRRLLGADGHVEGQAVARDPARRPAWPRGSCGTAGRE